MPIAIGNIIIKLGTISEAPFLSASANHKDTGTTKIHNIHISVAGMRFKSGRDNTPASDNPRIPFIIGTA